MPITVSKAALLIVEGRDDEEFFKQLALHLGLEDLQVENVEGEGNFEAQVAALRSQSNFLDIVSSLGIARDANGDPVRSFEIVQKALRRAGLPLPSTTLQPSEGRPKVTVMILPDSNSPRMLEDLCLRALAEDPAIPCVNQYVECLQTAGIDIGENNIPKAKMRAFLASKRDPKGSVSLWLGSAVRQDWWPWDDAAFDQVKDFLRQIAATAA